MSILSNRTSCKKSKAFTIVELLVIMAIVGILSTLVLVNYGRSKAKARDSKRVADLNIIMTAVETFRSVENRLPGTSGSWYQSNHNPWWSGSGATDEQFKIDLVLYLDPIPRDPLKGNNHLSEGGTELTYRYWRDNFTNTYKLDTGMEVSEDIVANDGGMRNNDLSSNPPGRYEIGTNLTLMN